MDSAILIAGHRAIIDAARAMLATLAAAPVDMAMLARHRMTLSLRVRDQLRHEDRMIMPRLNAERAALPPAVRDLLDRRTLMMRRYSEHVGQWNLQAVSADLPTFHAETAALVADVVALLAAKERTLFPHVQSLADRSPTMAGQPVPPLPIAS
ncbi:hypothetical protein [Sphingomonas abaci]|uniref:Hemerythrin-like domain-containing protein n=1 Tax=Sphingomonas abaci TaxID=237611 RepID=A0A7W7EZ46_9SPHN|nr:hypothetical protein [Sphingomonas abaci]MBB4619352.1 hypothetical protein [Sphingomonas abaci]